MPNMNGNAYFLTALFPVRVGMIDNETYEERLRAYLANLPPDSSSPFARRPITHFTRFVVIDQLGFNGEPSAPDPLASPFLLWTACFNGGLDRWLADIWQDMQAELDDILSYCEAYEGIVSADGFIQYVKRGQVTTSFPFADYPDATVEEVLEGLKRKKNFVSFLVDNQHGETAALKQNFFQWMEELEGKPTPMPGSMY